MKSLVFVIYLSVVTFNIFGQTWESIITPFANEKNEGIAIDLHHYKQYFTGVFEGNFNLGFNSLNGYQFNDIFFGKASLSGNTEWIKKIGGNQIDRANHIEVKDDMIAVSGTFVDSIFIEDDTLISSGQKSTFIAFYDTSGNYSHSFHPDCFNASFRHFKYDSNGDILITGEMFQSFSYGGFSMTVNSGINFFLLKYSPSLDSVLWGVFSDGNANLGRRVTIDLMDNIYVTGSYNDGTIFVDTLINTGNLNHNMFVAKFDTDGNREWLNILEGTGEVHGYGIVCDDSSNVFALGEFEGIVDVSGELNTSEGLFDAIIVKYDENGNRIWTETLGSIDSDEGYDLVLDENLDPILMIEAGVDPLYKGVVLPTYGFNEPLLLKIKNSDASIIWSKRLQATQNTGICNASSISIDGDYIAMTGLMRTSIEFEGAEYVANNNKDFYSVILKDSLTYHLNLTKDDMEIVTKVFPNPCHNQLYFESLSEIDEIKVYDLIGNLLDVFIVNNTIFTVNLSHYKEGSYILQIRQNEKFRTHKLLKMK